MTSLNDFYGFSHTPFTKSVALKDLYPSRGHCEIQGRLTFALQDRLAALITGDVGTGKSTAVRAFAQALDRNLYAVVYLPNPHLGVYDHTKGVARKINNLCRGALLLGATESKQILDETNLKRVILDLEGQVG